MTPVEIEVGRAVPAWALWTAGLVSGLAAVAVGGGDVAGWLLIGLGLLPLVMAPRSVGVAVFLGVIALALLRHDALNPLALAALLLTVHLTLILSSFIQDLPGHGRVQIEVLRRALPRFFRVQIVVQALGLMVWLLSPGGPFAGSGWPGWLTWVSVLAMAGIGVLGLLFVRELPQES